MMPRYLEPLESRVMLSALTATNYPFIPRYGTGNHQLDYLVQPDGKRLSVGFTRLPHNKIDVVFVRSVPDQYDFTATLDPSFGSGGVATVDSGGTPAPLRIRLQDDGKILAAGQTTRGKRRVGLVVRLNADGSIDKAFGTEGVVTLSLDHKLTRFNDVRSWRGKVIVTGSAGNDLVTVRFNADGTLDSSFNGTGFDRVNLGSSEAG